jgi:ribosomal 50S subunit-associated protein YjgA (DUF615 family)
MTDRMTPEQVRQLGEFIRHLFETIIEPMDLELTAHRTVIAALKTKYDDLDESLALARQNPVVRESVRKRIHEPLEKLLQRLSDSCLEEAALQKIIEKWRPEDTN